MKPSTNGRATVWARKILRMLCVMLVGIFAGVACVEIGIHRLGAPYGATIRSLLSDSYPIGNVVNPMLTRLAVALTVLSILFLPIHGEAAEAIQQTTVKVVHVKGMPAQVKTGSPTVYAHAASDSKADVDAAVNAALLANGFEQVDEMTLNNPHLLAYCIAVVVVVAVGSYVIYKVVQQCKKIKKKLDDQQTNAPPDDSKLKEMFAKAGGYQPNATSADTNVYAAVYVLGPVIGVQNQPAGSSAEIDVPFSCDPSAALTNRMWLSPVVQVVPQDQLVSFEEEAPILKDQYGVDLNTPNASYGSNGVPVGPLDKFTFQNGVVTIKVGDSDDVYTNVLLHAASPTGPWSGVSTNIIMGGSAHGVMSDGDPYPGASYYRTMTCYGHIKN